MSEAHPSVVSAYLHTFTSFGAPGASAMRILIRQEMYFFKALPCSLFITPNGKEDTTLATVSGVTVTLKESTHFGGMQMQAIVSLDTPAQAPR